jgi:DNA modification methylase
MMDLTVQMIPLASLRPDPANTNTMDAAEMAKLVRSLERFSFVDPIIVRESDGKVLGGNQRLEAARQLGLATLPVIYWEGSDEEFRVLSLALNKIHGHFDEALLAKTLADLADVGSIQEALRGFDTEFTALAGFDENEVLRLLGEHLNDTSAGENLAALVGPSETSPPATSTTLGDGFELGGHRVLCGDALDSDTVAALVGDSVVATVFTDPPYGVAYKPPAGRSGRQPRQRDWQRRHAIANDDLSQEQHRAFMTAALRNVANALAPGRAIYVCGGYSTTTVYDAAFESAGLSKSGIIVWDKGEVTLGRKDYASRYELIWYGWKPGAAHRFFGPKTESDIWGIPRDPAAFYLHPTQKPVALAARAIKNSTQPGETVLDLFGGSGSTLIAAHQLGRRALVLELDPHHIDTIVARWEALSGAKATAWRP